MALLSDYIEAKNNLENEFINLCHVVGNKNLSTLSIVEKNLEGGSLLGVTTKQKEIASNTQEIAQAMISFKKAFVAFRDELDKQMEFQQQFPYG
jgi:hypothetical protein